MLALEKAIGGDLNKPGLGQNVLMLGDKIISLIDKVDKYEQKLEDRVHELEKRQEETERWQIKRDAWIQGAHFVSASLGGMVMWLLMEFVFKRH